jgi:cytochrome c556
MKPSIKHWMLGALLSIAVLGGAAPAPAQDKLAIVKHRQALMTRQGNDLKKIRGYLDGKVDLAQAQASAADLIQTAKLIAASFPPGTATTDFPGKSGAKPEIWTEPDKFAAAQKTYAEKADALSAAVKSGDKAEIKTAFLDAGKNGCGNCHATFREKIQH